jgi:hypothetical protein
MKFLYIVILSLLSLQFFAQEKPDYGKIGVRIADESSDYYYPKLFGRYIAADRSLTVNDFRYLYYGFTFQAAYVPYADSEYRGNLAVFFDKKEINEEDLQQMIKYGNLILKTLPFDLRALQLLDYAYYHSGNRKKSDDAEFKRKMIIKAILSTGTGLSKNSGLHVIDDLHKFDLLAEKKLRYNGVQRIANNSCEFMGVFENDKNIRGMYFNIGRLYQVSAERLKGQ